MHNIFGPPEPPEVESLDPREHAMSEVSSLAGAAKGLSRNPLGIIALFLVLIYGFAALALGFSSHLEVGARSTLVWFLVLFPVAVLAMFGWLVSRHHEKLYAPSDYRSDEGFFVPRALSERRMAELRTEHESLKARVRKTILELPTKSNASKITAELVADQITADIDKSTRITVDASLFLRDGAAVYTYPVAAFATVSDLTNAVYFELASHVRPFTYGHSWILRDKQSGNVVKTTRMLTNAGPGRPLNDPRSLTEVGVTPGTTLLVERLEP